MVSVSLWLMNSEQKDTTETQKPVVVQFEKTPKALANLSPGFERSENPREAREEKILTLKGFIARRTLTGFKNAGRFSQGCRCAPTLG